MSDDQSANDMQRITKRFRYPPVRSRISPVTIGGVAVAVIALVASVWLFMGSPLNRGRASTVAIIGNNINCRAEPNRNANVVRRLSGYAEFKSNKSEGDWVRIGTTDEACWANATYVVLNADVKAREGEGPRLVEYLKRPISKGEVVDKSLPSKRQDSQISPNAITGIWGADVDECSGSDTALFFKSNGDFWGYGLGNARWVYDGRKILIRWGKYEGDELNEPHDAGQAVGAIDWLTRDRISIAWQPYGNQDWGSEIVIRCP